MTKPTTVCRLYEEDLNKLKAKGQPPKDTISELLRKSSLPTAEQIRLIVKEELSKVSNY